MKTQTRFSLAGLALLAAVGVGANVIKYLPPKDLFKNIIPKNLFQKERQYGQFTQREISKTEYQNLTGDATNVRRAYAVTDNKTGEDYFVVEK